MAGGTGKSEEVAYSGENSCAHLMREEFRCSSFGFSHPRPHLLVSDQWGFPRLYVGWRVFWAVYHLVWCMYDWTIDAIETDRPGVWLIYLTNWTFVVLTAYTLLAAITVTYVTCTVRDFQDGQTPWYLKVVWVVYELASVASILVTILYFALLFSGSLSMLSGVKHLANSVYVLLDFFITAMPVRLLHVIYPSIYAVVYCVFTVIYWAAGGVNDSGFHYVYKSLDWNNAGSAGPTVVGVIFVAIPLVHLVFWSLHVIRVAIYANCCVAEERGGSVCMEMHGNEHSSVVHAESRISPA